MKVLYLCRHAKSSWADGGMDDFDRPLNERGLRNAPHMAEAFKGRGEPLDLIVSSPAMRAKITAGFFKAAMSIRDQAYREDRSIYHADRSTLQRIVNDLPNGADRVMLFGHMPGFGQLVDHLTDSGISALPTCGLVRIDLTVDDWSLVTKASGTLVWFDYPKRYPGQD